MKDSVEFKAEYDAVCYVALAIAPVTIIIVFFVLLITIGWEVVPLSIIAATLIFELLLFWSILPHYYVLSEESLYIQLGYPFSWTVPMSSIVSAKDISDDIYVVWKSSSSLL